MAGRSRIFTDAQVREIRHRANEIRALGGNVSPSRFSHEYGCSTVVMNEVLHHHGAYEDVV